MRYFFLNRQLCCLLQLYPMTLHIQLPQEGSHFDAVPATKLFQTIIFWSLGCFSSFSVFDPAIEAVTSLAAEFEARSRFPISGSQLVAFQDLGRSEERRQPRRRFPLGRGLQGQVHHRLVCLSPLSRTELKYSLLIS